jgi:single-strand DNA-binding protein
VSEAAAAVVGSLFLSSDFTRKVVRMPSFNRVTLMGNLTRDPQVKQLPTTTVAEFGLAMSRRFKASDGEDREEVCFVDCAAFGRQAETIAQYCTKGRPIFLEGRLKFDSWDDRSGNKRSKVSVVVENFQFIGPRGEDGGHGGRPGAVDHADAASDAPASAAAPASDHGRGAPANGGESGHPVRNGGGNGRRSHRGALARSDVGEKAKFAQADIPF